MWNEFSFVNTLTQSAQNRTLPLAIWEFQGQYSMNTPMIMAVLTLTLLPMVIMFIIFQDKLVKGMTAGAVKGWFFLRNLLYPFTIEHGMILGR